MAEPRLLTLAEAADTLNLSTQRIHQLLLTGGLDGPDRPVGRLRFPPNAGRVTRDSIDRLLHARAAAADVHPKTTRGAVALASPTAGSANSAADDQVRAAAQELKVKLDVLRDQIRAERARNRKLIDVASDLLAMLKTASDDADTLDDVTDGYSHALTQLLSPDAPTA
jgi:hypothetical protein